MNNDLGSRIDSAEFRHSIKDSLNSIRRFRYSQSPAYARIRLQREFSTGIFRFSDSFLSSIEKLQVGAQSTVHSSNVGGFNEQKADNTNENTELDLDDNSTVNQLNSAKENIEPNPEVRTSVLLKRLGFRLSAIFDSFQVIVLGVREPLLIFTLLMICLVTLGSLFSLLFLIEHYTPR